MADNDTAQLVARILRDAKVPEGSTYEDSATLLGMADAETRSLVLQHVLRASGDYLARYVDVPITGKRAYRLPARAIRLKEVERYNAEGVALPFSSVDSAQAAALKDSGRHWYFEENAVVPLLEPEATGTLRIRYYRWPARLVLPSECATVTAVEDGVLTTTGATLTGTVDVVKGTPGFEGLGDSLPVLSNTAGTGDSRLVTLDGDVSEVEVGDVLCPPGTTCFPQLPLAFHDVVAAQVAAKIQREQKDFEGAAATKAEAGEKSEGALATVSPRSKTERAVVSKTWF